MQRGKGIEAIRYVEAWCRRLRGFSLHAHVVKSCVGAKREKAQGGKGQAAAVVEGSAFAADFERALWVLARRRRVLVVGVGVLELPVALAGRIAGMTPGEAYVEYEDACMRVFAVMERGGYGE